MNESKWNAGDKPLYLLGRVFFLTQIWCLSLFRLKAWFWTFHRNNHTGIAAEKERCGNLEICVWNVAPEGMLDTVCTDRHVDSKSLITSTASPLGLLHAVDSVIRSTGILSTRPPTSHSICVTRIHSLPLMIETRPIGPIATTLLFKGYRQSLQYVSLDYVTLFLLVLSRSFFVSSVRADSQK